MALFRIAKRPLKIFLYNQISTAGYHTHGNSTWASHWTPISKSTEIKDLFSIRYANPTVAFLSISRQFSDQAPAASGQMNLIRQLRERTSAPIKDVKLALVDCNWNIGNKSYSSNLTF